ncbi:hypothetical protein J0X14_17675 [Muricauda sp. CAU 1633]|uniref:hypothetical protein n=1 Tax=Allomuricauda sp. CAU 1633 TaxID=2816036 RepID=UPI001A8FCF14|nr:hypothetical protein [Muricauda sp. CAU 1633]MBO0324144.1 hypothetical protein [Muricauda sp. CAU 1633]
MKFKNLTKAMDSLSGQTHNGPCNKSVYFELPSVEILYSKEGYPWHMQAVVEFEFDKNKIERLQAEIELQLQIGHEISRVLDHEAVKYIKVGSYIKNGTIVHDFYLDRCLRQPTPRSTNILMGIAGYRSVSFSMNQDKNWKSANSYFSIFGCDGMEPLYQKLLDLNISFALAN